MIVTYWGFRIMITFGILAAGVLFSLLKTRSPEAVR